MRAAIICGGQGSQANGMGGLLTLLQKSLPQIYTTVKHDKCVQALKASENETNDKLTPTNIAQPLVFMHAKAFSSLINTDDQKTKCILGHSLGEYSALHISGAIDFESGYRLATVRGNLMNDIVTQNSLKYSMAACIPAAKDTDFRTKLTSLCQEISQLTNLTCQVANINSPTQIVISGNEEAIDKCIEIGTERKVFRRSKKLSVGAPFHCNLMAPCIPELRKQLDDTTFHDFNMPFVSAITAKEVQNPLEMRQILLDHCVKSVEWHQSIEYVHKRFDINTFIEIGLGGTLSSLVKQILPNANVKTVSLGTQEDIETWKGDESLNELLNV